MTTNKMNKEMNFCQSCGMPLTEEVLGTNVDGSKNEDYCMYCYKVSVSVFPHCSIARKLLPLHPCIKSINYGCKERL